MHSFVQDHLDLEFSVHESVGPGCSFGNFILKTGSCLETCIQQKPRKKSHEICKEVDILVYVSKSNSCLHWCFVKQIAWSYLHSGGILHGGLWPSIGTEVKARFGIDIQILGSS